MDAMQVRLDVLALALATLARAVPADLAGAVQDGLRRDVAQRLSGVSLSAKADEAVAADLGSLLSALADRAAWSVHTPGLAAR
jgi:hypothetical protein